MLRDKNKGEDEAQYITTFYEDYGYIPIGVDINKFELDNNNFYYIPKDPRTFFIGKGANQHKVKSIHIRWPDGSIEKIKVDEFQSKTPSLSSSIDLE